MKWFRLTMALGILACAAPFAAPFLALAISSYGNCPPGQGGPAPCMIGGSDWGGTIYHLSMMPWLLLFTIYIAAFLFLTWIVVETVHAVRKNRAKPS